MMKYLFIVLIILFVVAPLLWVRQTPGQARVTAFRNRALQLGLRVQLVPLADAAPDDRSLDAVRYLRPLLPDQHGAEPLLSRHWTLLHADRHGSPSPFEGWRWFRDEAPAISHPAIAECLAALPASVVALRLDAQGVSAYWHETGDIQQVNAVASALESLLAAFLAGFESR